MAVWSKSNVDRMSCEDYGECGSRKSECGIEEANAVVAIPNGIGLRVFSHSVRPAICITPLIPHSAFRFPHLPDFRIHSVSSAVNRAIRVSSIVQFSPSIDVKCASLSRGPYSRSIGQLAVLRR
jgi:hypothetical protein